MRRNLICEKFRFLFLSKSFQYPISCIYVWNVSYFFITCYISPNWILPSCFILLCILAKIFLLYLLFVTFEKFFPNSELIKVVEELKTNSTRRKYSLLLSFGYDTIIMLCFALHDMIEYRFEWISLLCYEIITLGGVLMFYITLFGLWKIQDKKIKKTK